MTWQLTYTVFGSRGLRSIREHYETRDQAESAARRQRIQHYEIWRIERVVQQ